MRSKRHLNTQQKYFFGISNWFLKPEKKRVLGMYSISNKSTNTIKGESKIEQRFKFPWFMKIHL